MTRLLIIFLTLVTFCFQFPIAFSQTAARDSGNEPEIIERFWQVLLKSPRFGTSFDRVYNHYSDAGELQSLLERAKKLTLEDPNKGEHFLLLGMLLSKQDDFDETIAAYRKAESLMPDDATAPTCLADVFIAQGQLQDAADALERALTKRSRKNETVALLQKLGWVYERLGQREKAAETWKNMERLFPDDVNVLSRIAGTLEREGKYPESLAMYEKLMTLTRTPKDANAHVRFGLAAADIKIRLGNKQAAIEDFERLLDGLNEKSWASDNIRNRIERIFVRNGDYSGLARYYQQRLESRPDDRETSKRYAVVLVRLSQYDAAAKLLQNTIEKSPSDIPLKLLLAELFTLQGRFSDAVSLYEQISRLAPGNIDYLTQWGLAVLNNRELPDDQRREEAAAIWSQIAETNPDAVVMAMTTARLFADHGFDDQAETFFQKAIALRPNDAAMYEQLGHFYHRKNSPKKAVETFQQIAAGTRRSVDSLLQLAGIFEKLGMTENAIQSLHEAVELAPERFDLRIRLAEMCFDLSDYDAAQTQLHAAERLAESDEQYKRLTACETRLLLETNRLQHAARELAASLAGDAVQQLPPKTRAKLNWKLAVFRSTLGETEAAIRAIERAMTNDANSPVLLQAAAEIARKSQASDNAATLLWRLTELDKPRQIEHLQSLVMLYRDLGEMDKAVETAEKILLTGTKNPAHYRSLAELLFSIDQNDRAVVALRSALQADPNDHATLAMLADILFKTGRTDEALESAWRIFDQAENLEMKMAAVDRLVVYYRQLGRFDQLIARLQTASDAGDLTSDVGQKEIAYCTARAYSGIADYDSARKTLESLLLVGDADAASDAVLLEHLSVVAEIQGDAEGAMRFQEMLLDVLPKNAENTPAVDRLLTLYYGQGNREKATALLKKMTLAKKEFREQLDMVDSLSMREEYVATQEILDALAVVHGEHWELLARRMVLENWTNSPNAATIARQLLAFKLPPETRAVNARPLDELKTTSTLAGFSTTPWLLGELPIRVSMSVDFESPESLRQYAVQLVGTVFREHLVAERRYASRSGMTKPEPVLETLADAKRLAELVLFRSEIRSDQREGSLAAVKRIDDRRQSVFNSAAIDANILKEQYVFESLLQLFDETGPLAKYYPNFSESLAGSNAANLQAVDFSDQLAVILAIQGENGWQNEGLLRLLDRLLGDGSEIRRQADAWRWLLATLDEKSRNNDFAASKAVWEKAVMLDVALQQANDIAEAKAFATVVADAGNRSYLVRLLQAEQVADFELFADDVRKALAQYTQNIAENTGNATQAYADFSQTFERHLASQRQRMIETQSPELAEQLTGSVDFWHKTVDRVQYGQKTLRAFFSDIRSAPGLTAMTVRQPVSSETLRACDQYETYAYRVLDFWLTIDNELYSMRETESAETSLPRLASGNAWFTMVDLNRQIGRDKPVNLNIVSYLVNRSAFGVPGSTTRSMAGSATSGDDRSKICLDMAATLSAIDRFLFDVAANPEAETDLRLKRFETYLNERKITALCDERNDIARIKEMIVAYQNTGKVRENGAEIESPEQLRHKAEQRLAGINDRNNSDIVPMLIALIMIELAENNTEEAVELLDAVPCRQPAEMKARELIRLKLTLNAENDRLRQNRDAAIEKLAGYQLSEDELMEFRAMLKETDRAETTDIMFNRLVTIATNPRNRRVLLDEFLEKAQNNPAEKERLVAFALKIFRSTPTRGTLTSEEAVEQVRLAAVKALDWAGKLDEIAAQLEVQVENAPGAVTFLKQLAELHVQMGRVEEAKQLVRQMAENMPNDVETMLDYAKFLVRLEMNDEAERWTEKALLLRPELFFSSTESYRQMLGNRKTLEMLANFDPAIISGNAFYVFMVLGHASDDPDVQPTAQKLFDRFWNETAIAPKDLAALQQTAVRSLAEDADVFFYPYYRQWMLDAVSAEQAPVGENALFKVTYWYDHKPKTFASTFFRLAKNNGKLEEFLGDIQKTVAAHESQRVNRDRKRYGYAKILEAATFFALNRPSEGVEAIKVIEKQNDDLLTEAALTLGLCMETGGSPDADPLLWYYEKAYQADPHQAYQPFYLSRFSIFALESKQPERREFGLKQTTENLREMLSAFEKLGENGYASLELGYFSQNALVDFAQLYTDSLIKANQQPVVRKAFDELVLNKPWFQQWQDDSEYSELFNKLQRISKSVGAAAR